LSPARGTSSVYLVVLADVAASLFDDGSPYISVLKQVFSCMESGLGLLARGLGTGCGLNVCGDRLGRACGDSGKFRIQLRPDSIRQTAKP
jgi:hypothetical protein